MSDILFDNLVFDRLREIGDQSDRIAALESEIARLRLTAAEREAVAYYLGTGGPYRVDATLVAMLSRTGSPPEKTAADARESSNQA